MAFGYVKKTWVDRLTEFPTRRILTDTQGNETTVTVARSEGTVSQEGDAFNAENMNGLETRIDNALTQIDENLNAMVDTRYNPDNGEAEWKEQGADTWHPFSSKFTTCISGDVSYNTSSYSSNFTLDKDCNHIVVLLPCGGNSSAYITSYSVKQNGQTLTQNIAGSYLPDGWLNWIMAEYVGSFKSGDVVNCSYSLSHKQSYLTSGIMY